MAVQYIRVQYDVDSQPLEESRRVAQQLARDLGLSEAEAERLNREFQEQSGILQRLRIRERELLQARERSTDPRQIQRMNREIQEARNRVNQLTGATQQQGDSLKKLAMLAGAAFAVQRVTAFAGEMVNLFDVQAKAEAKVKQGIESTNNAAKLSFAELKREAEALQADTLFGDEEILNSATAQLLTFTNIAGDNFKRTQTVALDLATVLDGDLKSSSIQLGKALNDPVANLSALSRSGIQFSKEQKDVIKELANTNRLAEAQTLILDELERQYGGQAKAATAGAGAFKQLGNQVSDIKENIGGFIVQGLGPMVSALSDLIAPTQQESDLLREQQVEVNVLTGILLDNTAAQETKAEALRQLSQIQPEIVEGISAEAVNTELLTTRLAAVNEQYEKRIRLALAQEKVAALQEKLNSGVKGAVAAEIRLNKAFAERFGVEAQRNTTLEDQIRIMKELNQGNIATLLDYQILENRQQGLKAITEELSFAQKNLTETQKETGESAGTAAPKVEGLGDAIEGTGKKSKGASGALKQFKVDVDSIIEGLGDEPVLEQVFDPDTDFTIPMPDPDDIRGDLSGFADAYREGLSEALEGGDSNLFEDLFGEPEEFFNSVLGTAQQVVGIIGDLLEAQNQRQLSDLEEREQKALAMAGDNAEKREQIQAQFEKRREELERQAAIKRKRVAIAEAVIQTALNVIKTLANPFQAALVAAAGAAQIAVIANQGFKKGGFTGYGDSSEVAGPVHKEEFVIDAPTTRALGLRGKSMRDFQALVSPMVVKPEIYDRVAASGGSQDFGKLGDRIVKGIAKEIGRMPVDVTVMDEYGFRRFQGSVDTWKFYLNQMHG